MKKVFETELAEKQRLLAAAQAKLQRATRELSHHRQRLTAVQSIVAQRDEHRHSIANLKRIVAQLSSSPPSSHVSHEQQAWVEKNLAAVQVPSAQGPVKELVRLRWLQLWLAASTAEWERKLAGAADEGARKEAQCRKVVAMCCGVDEERVAGILDDLVVAIESDGTETDFAKVAGFLSKVSS